MLGPSTSSERSTVIQGDPHQHDGTHIKPEYDNVTATAAAAVSASGYGAGLADEANQFNHQQSYANAEFQHRAELQRRQQQLQQQELHHQQQLQQFHQQQQQQQHLQQQQQRQQQQQQQQQQHLHQLQHVQHGIPEDYDNGGILGSRFIENEIIKTFPSKPYLVKYVKDILSVEERCKIVINSSKPKAVYFQCERSGSFRTTVKDLAKRQRVAYTKRNKCGYRLVANLYPPEKDKKKEKKPDAIDDKLAEFSSDPSQITNEMWILRMINPVHNHPPEPLSGKKKRLKNARTLVEKPLHRSVGSAAVAAAAAAGHYVPGDVLQLAHSTLHHHHQLHHEDDHTPSVQDAAVIAAIEAAPAAAAALHSQNAHTPVDPNIDPNVDPSVQAHDHAHLRQFHPGLRR